jgi:hypothetical protein
MYNLRLLIPTEYSIFDLLAGIFERQSTMKAELKASTVCR